MSDETLEDMAEGPRYAESILQTHKPVHPGPGRTRCPVCEAWYPCDLVSLAARVMLDRADLARQTERAEAAEQQAARLRAALGPIMAYLVTTDEMAGHQGNLKPGDVRSDKLANVNDVWLLRSDIARLSAALAASQPAPAVEAHEYEGACRNVQHAATGACACIALVNGRLCRLSRINPIHQPAARCGGQAEGEG